MRKLLLLPIRFYQYCLSPLLPSRCRYYPTCSQYAADAITQHGAANGSWLALKRLLRCHPWGDSGYDPVPGADSNTHSHVPTTHETRQ